MFLGSVLAASGQEELPGRLHGSRPLPAEPVELTGVVRMIGSSLESSPALILDEQSIQNLDGRYSALGIIGSGAAALVENFQGQEVTVMVMVLDRERYDRQYRETYPLSYRLFQGFALIEEPGSAP